MISLFDIATCKSVSPNSFWEFILKPFSRIIFNIFSFPSSHAWNVNSLKILSFDFERNFNKYNNKFILFVVVFFVFIVRERRYDKVNGSFKFILFVLLWFLIGYLI